MTHQRRFGELRALLADLMERAAPLLDQPHLESVRDGLTSLLPILTLGSLSLLLRDLPLASWQTYTANHVWISEVLQFVFHLTYGWLSLYVVCAVAYRLARRKAVGPMWPVALAIANLGVLTRTEVWPRPAPRFGPENLLVAISAALITVEACARFLARSRSGDGKGSTAEQGRPGLLGILFSFAVVGLAVLVRSLSRLPAFTVLAGTAARVASGLSSGPVCVLAEAAHSALWMMGINGNLILGSALQPLLTGNAVANGLARWSGQTPHWIYSDLFRVYVNAGGSGATLPLAVYLSRSPSRRLRQVGRKSLRSGFFNINEGLIFGAPIIFNPLLATPFVAVTALNAAVAYLAHSLGWVTPAYICLPGTLPSPLFALLSTGFDVRALALSTATWLIIPGIIWLPFYRGWERRVLATERDEAQDSNAQANQL